MTDGSEKTLRYAYDLMGRLISIMDEYGKEIINYHHTPGGKLKEICHHNGVKITYQYDTEGNIIHLRTKTKEDKLLCDLQYEYDLNGNRTAKMGSMALPDVIRNISLQSRDIHYRHDRRNRLLSELSGKQETCYRYDLCGNRLEKRQGKRKEESYYNKKNQLTERISENDAWQYSYDSQGNLIQKSDPKRNLQYIYDTQNRQTHILSGKTVIQENRYDGEGLRAGLNVQGKESTFLFTNGNLALELDEFNQPVNRYIRGYGVAALEHHGIYYGIHRDEQLSTRWITGVSGEIENACEYDAFENLLGNHEEVPNCILYGGQQYDAETEQYYLRARYYNPVIGRFVQEDPYRGDGLNLYAYCGNNPVVYYDPSGNECVGNANAKENVQRENVTESETAVEISEIDFELLENGNGLRDWMSPEEAQRYDNYWKQGAGSFRNVKTADGNRKEVIISSGDKINTRQRLQTAPGTRSIIDVKYSKETNDMYYRETIFDVYGRKIGTNDYTDHKRPAIPNHTIPHYHANSPTNPSQHGTPHPGIHPSTPEN